MASQSSRLLEDEGTVAPRHDVKSLPEGFEGGVADLRPTFFRAVVIAVPLSLAMWAGIAWLAVQTIR